MLIYAKTISGSDELKQIPPPIHYSFAKNHPEKTVYWDHLGMEIVYQGMNLICSVCGDNISSQGRFFSSFHGDCRYLIANQNVCST